LAKQIKADYLITILR